MKWSDVDTKLAGRAVDRLLHGKTGAWGTLRLAVHNAKRGRPDLARKGLSMARALYAAVEELGWWSPEFKETAVRLERELERAP